MPLIANSTIGMTANKAISLPLSCETRRILHPLGDQFVLAHPLQFVAE